MLIAISGMVGTGKTTLARALARYFGFAAALESAGEENPWLAPFYGEPDGMRRYALPLQLHVLARRMEMLRQIRAEQADWIIDRTWYEDAEIFARGLYEDGYLTPLEFDLYQRLYYELSHEPAAHAPRLLIFLDGPIEEIEARIVARGRPEEQGVPFEYWHALHARYQRWARSFHLCRMLALDIRSFDVVADPGAVDRVASLVRAALGKELTRAAVQFRLGLQ